MSLFCLNACAQAGWIGYYSIKNADGSENKIDYNTDNGVVLELANQEVWVDLPRDCSSFGIAGFFTPITPPIPMPPVFRSWATGNSKCNFFTIETKPSTAVSLKVGEKTYDPEVSESFYGYTKYIFPIRAKNLDSGILIIEKNGEKVEVPFEYKYFRFWN